MATTIDSNDDISNNSVDKDEINIQRVGLSTSFTINFDEDDNLSFAKPKKLNRPEDIISLKHIRTLSLPINEYLSSKGEVRTSGEKPENLININEIYNKTLDNVHTQEKRHVKDDLRCVSESIKNDSIKSNSVSKELESSVMHMHFGSCETSDDHLFEVVSDDSGGGTYTLDKEDEQVKVARKSIDQVFGIFSNNESHRNNIPKKIQEKSDKNHLIDKWIDQVSSSVTLTEDESVLPSSVTVPKFKQSKSNFTKEPSSNFTCEDLNSVATVISSTQCMSNSLNINKAFYPFNSIDTKASKTLLLNSPVNDKIDTEQYLKDTAYIVSAVQNKLQFNEKHNLESLKDVQYSKKSTSNKYSTARFNRAFSLRRDRLKKTQSSVAAPSISVHSKNIPGINSLKPYLHFSNECDEQPVQKLKKNFNTSSYIKHNISTSHSSSKFDKEDNVTQKKIPGQRLKMNNGEIRSNSSLTAQEIEFQNWKRRKNYDPIKAAAKDKKKKPTNIINANSNTDRKKKNESQLNDENTISEKPFVRSASFHGICNESKPSLLKKNLIHSTNNLMSTRNLDENIIDPRKIQQITNKYLWNSKLQTKFDDDTITIINIAQLSNEIRTAVFSLINTLSSNEELMLEIDNLSKDSKNQNNFKKSNCNLNILTDDDEKNFVNNVSKTHPVKNGFEKIKNVNSSNLNENCVSDYLSDIHKNLEQTLTIIQKLHLTDTFK